jgi:hypothetical protein
MYEYVAYNNPQGALNLLNSYGLRIRDQRNLGASLRKLVAQEGEPALRKIAELHPDKELLMDVYSNADGGCGCGCGGNKSMGKELMSDFLGADAVLSSANITSSANAQMHSASESSKLGMQTNAFLIVATMIIALAIITRK